MVNKKRDGHMHSHYCPHGSDDSFIEYLNVAIENGLEEITFTEHMTIPRNFMDNEFLSKVSLDIKNLEAYFNELLILKEEYKDKIKINIGVEVDYIEGYEEFTKGLLDKYGNIIDDSILSVHFGRYKDKYYAFDYLKSFEDLLSDVGSVEKIYDLYFETLLKSIKSDLGQFKPKRIGHPTLIRIFNKKYPICYKNDKLFKEIIAELKKNKYELDLNTAGLRKEFCGEVYPSGDFYYLAKFNNIKFVCGSDAHSAKDVGFNFNYFK